LSTSDRTSRAVPQGAGNGAVHGRRERQMSSFPGIVVEGVAEAGGLMSWQISSGVYRGFVRRVPLAAVPVGCGGVLYRPVPPVACGRGHRCVYLSLRDFASGSRTGCVSVWGLALRSAVLDGPEHARAERRPAGYRRAAGVVGRDAGQYVRKQVTSGFFCLSAPEVRLAAFCLRQRRCCRPAAGWSADRGSHRRVRRPPCGALPLRSRTDRRAIH